MNDKKETCPIGIRGKITLLIGICASFIGCVGVLLGHYWGGDLIRTDIITNQKTTADFLASSIDHMFEIEVAEIITITTTPTISDFIKEKNSRYSGLQKEEVVKLLINKDKQWLSSSPTSPFLKEYLQNSLSLHLQHIVKGDHHLREFFITDQFGGLIASSGKTTDFFQADEDWWQTTYNNGRGEMAINEIAFDESSDTYAIPLSIPIKNNIGTVIGIAKAIIDVLSFWKPVQDFRTGENGHAAIINKKGSILFHPSHQLFGKQYAPLNDLNRLLSNKDRWTVLDKPHFHKKKMLITFSPLKHSLLRASNRFWYVVIDQEEEAAFALLNKYLFIAALLIPLLIGLSFPVGSVSAGFFVKPIKRLQEATDKVRHGDFNWRLNNTSRDEVGDLSRSFNSMVQTLENQTISIDTLNKEIKERKSTEEKLIVSEREWFNTFDSIADFLFIQDTNFSILKINKTCLDKLGLRADQVIGKKCYEVFHELKTPWYCCPFEKTKQDWKAHSSEVNDQNFGIPLLTTTSPVFNNKGVLTGSVHYAIDISEQKKAEDLLEKSNKELEAQTWGLNKTNESIKLLYKELKNKNDKLEELDQLKSDFVSTVSHELRTPLTIIKGNISLLIDQIPGTINIDQEQILSTTANNITRLARIINELLDISKIESGRIELEKETISVNTLIHQVTFSFKGEISAKGLTFEVRLPDEEVKVFLDHDKIIQVLTNLVGNALKFTEEGKITITLHNYTNEIKIVISDTGTGIAPDDLDKIFEKFHQGTNQQGFKIKGTGLGLAISKRLTELHEGTLTVESEFGKGASFIVSLPK